MLKVTADANQVCNTNLKLDNRNTVTANEDKGNTVTFIPDIRNNLRCEDVTVSNENADTISIFVANRYCMCKHEHGDNPVPAVAHFMLIGRDECQSCIDGRLKSQYQDFRTPPEPCRICSFPVYRRGYSSSVWEDKLGAICSSACLRILRRNERIAKRATARANRVCISCQQLFTPPRSDAKTCSNRCRQAAHRNKQIGGAA